MFRVEINSTDPIPFYSSQSNECPKGLVGIINPSKTENITDYKKRASGLAKGVTPGTKVFGGEVVDDDSNSDSDNGDDSSKSGDDSDSGKDSSKDGDKGSNGRQLTASLGFLFAAGVAALFV